MQNPADFFAGFFVNFFQKGFTFVQQCVKIEVLSCRKGWSAMKRGKFKPSALDELYDAILCLETKEECSAFFDDLCTVLELQTLSQRLQVAKMLREHHVYSDIVNVTGASTVHSITRARTAMTSCSTACRRSTSTRVYRMLIPAWKTQKNNSMKASSRVKRGDALFLKHEYEREMNSNIFCTKKQKCNKDGRRCN